MLKLTPGRKRLLQAIADRADPRFHQMCHAADLTPPLLSRLWKELRNEGYVAFKHIGSDSDLILITDSGRAALAAA